MDRTLHLSAVAFTDTMERVFSSLRWERTIELHNAAQLALVTYRDVELTVGTQIELARQGWNFDSINFNPKTKREREITAYRIYELAQKALNARMVGARSDMLLTTTCMQRGKAHIWEDGLPSEPVVANYTATFLYMTDRRKYLANLMKYIRETKPDLETLQIAYEDLTGTACDVVQFIIENWPSWQEVAGDIHDMMYHGKEKSKLLKRLRLSEIECQDWADTALIIASY